MRTQEQIRQQINGLKEILAKPTFRRTTFFGGSNEDAIKAQIEVLETGMDSDDVDEKVDSEEWDSHVGDSAYEATNWLEDDHEISPVEGWEGLY